MCEFRKITGYVCEWKTVALRVVGFPTVQVAGPFHVDEVRFRNLAKADVATGDGLQFLAEGFVQAAAGGLVVNVAVPLVTQLLNEVETCEPADIGPRAAFELANGACLCVNNIEGVRRDRPNAAAVVDGVRDHFGKIRARDVVLPPFHEIRGGRVPVHDIPGAPVEFLAEGVVLVFEVVPTVTAGDGGGVWFVADNYDRHFYAERFEFAPDAIETNGRNFRELCALVNWKMYREQFRGGCLVRHLFTIWMQYQAPPVAMSVAEQYGLSVS